MNEGVKKQLTQSGIFTGMILFFFLALSLFSVLGRKNWERGLCAAVEQVLPPAEWQCGSVVKINSNLSASAACFDLIKKNESSKKRYALVLRITSYLGPLPAVFVLQDGKAEFMGVAYLESSMAQAFVDGKDDSQMLYWKKLAEDIAKDLQKEAAKK